MHGLPQYEKVWYKYKGVSLICQLNDNFQVSLVVAIKFPDKPLG